MKRAFAIAALLASVAIAAIDPRLMKPIGWDDPSAMSLIDVPSNQFNRTLSVFIGEPTAEWTVITWMKTEARTTPSFMFSCHPARATREGGAELPDLIPYQQLTLSSSGTWGATLSDTSYDRPSYWTEEYGWNYGCYCVNIKTDTALTLTVRGAEKNITASPDMQIFNIQGETSSAAVTIAAAPGATVFFGIAKNPLIEFVGDNLQYADQQTASVVNLHAPSNAWQFVALRARIADSGSTAQYHFLARVPGTGKEAEGGKSNTLEYPCSGTFVKDCRIDISWYTCLDLWGFNHGDPYPKSQIYGAKAASRWMTDNEIERIFDIDKEWLRRKGLLREQ